MQVTAAGFLLRLLVAAIVSAIATLAAAQPGSRVGLPAPADCPFRASSASNPIASTCANGPGTDYPTAWVYRRAGLPLEVIKEFEGWRQVRDADGAAGWVLQSFLSGRRTALVLPWEIKAGHGCAEGGAAPQRQRARPRRRDDRSRRHRQPGVVRRPLVQREHRQISRLHRAEEAVGRLRGRGHQLARRSPRRSVLLGHRAEPRRRCA